MDERRAGEGVRECDLDRERERDSLGRERFSRSPSTSAVEADLGLVDGASLSIAARPPVPFGYPLSPFRIPVYSSPRSGPLKKSYASGTCCTVLPLRP